MPQPYPPAVTSTAGARLLVEAGAVCHAGLAWRGGEVLMGEPARNASALSDLPGMDPASVAERRRRLEEQSGPWDSDEEFEEYLAFVKAHRGRPST
jgi:hypothetical protein